MKDMATLSTSNKKTNNCGKLKYILRTKLKKHYSCLKLHNMQTQQSKTDANLTFQEREREREREEREREREREGEREIYKIILNK